MQIVEKLVVPRSPRGPSLDAVVATDRWAGVVDQSTPKDEGEPDLLEAFREAIEGLSSSAVRTARDVVDVISASIQTVPPSATGRPCLTFAIVDALQRRIVRVGDCHVVIGDRELLGRNPVDEVLGPMRSLVVELSRLGGDDPSEAEGRSVILPWIKESGRMLRNHPTSRFGFGAVDGSVVPDRYVEEFTVPPDVSLVAVTTDGYVRPSLHLRDAEQSLADEIRLDPTMSNRGTKGRGAGDNSFDDRAFVNVDLGERA